MIKDLFHLFFPRPLINIYTKEKIPNTYSWAFRKERFRFAAKKKIRRYKRTLMLPICLILNHNYYREDDWSYSRMYCQRCNYVKSLWESK